jgi:HD superfamily phosphodiesterase
MLEKLFLEMISYYSGDPKRIQHFTKVHSYAKLIGEREQLSPEELYILEAAAYTHDIGIKPAEEKYGSSEGKLQEQEGPIVAQRMLSDVGIENYLIDRICYLIGHHHTYDNIEGLDYQILVEADFLVNLYEDDVNRHGIEQAYQQIFQTQTGKEIFNQMYTDER